MKADIAILGSGFAGSLVALVMHQRGFRPVVVDRAVHPRFAIGESSTPVADMILRDLAERYDLPRIKPLSRYGTWKEAYPQIDVGRKRGFSYFHHGSSRAFRPDPNHSNELLVAASSDDALSDTHWYRADVDAFLAGEIRSSGIPLLENTDITRIDIDASSGRSVVHAVQDGRDEIRIAAEFIIDATGAGSALSRALNISDTSDRFHTRSRTLFSHFEDVPLWQDLFERAGGRSTDHPFDCDAAALHHVLDKGWMWMLRFDSGIVSAGFMLDERHHPAGTTTTPEEEWSAWIDRYPSLSAVFENARFASAPGRLIRSAGRLQRRAARVAGHGWAMLPHTAGFVDPLHSTGIAHSLSGVERLAQILEDHWRDHSLAAELARYERQVHQELDFIDTLVGACYASMQDFRLFTTSTMLYFAAVIAYERRRSESPCIDGMFLSADIEELRDLAADATRWLEAGVVPSRYAAAIEERIRPFNTAGLFRPAVPNMYLHTSARV